MTVYQEIVQITTDYLGPAAERFISRQITFHLNKEPDQLTKEDIPNIAQKIKGSLSLLTQDQKLVTEAVDRISKLSN